MAKVYTEAELRELGMDENQIAGIMNVYAKENLSRENREEPEETAEPVIGIPISNVGQVVQFHQHDVEVHVDDKPLVPTSLEQIASYKKGVIVELPPFADGQPFVVRMVRPSMLKLVKSGKIPNTLLNQATALFANGANALGTNGRNSTNVNELFDVIDVIVESALLQPTLKEIRSVGMELTDEQLMAIFSYTQRGNKALEQFRTKRTDSERNSNVEIVQSTAK